LRDVIDTYYAQGVYNPERWYFVQYAGVDAGVLLLSENPDSSNWELVYMGVTPQARGRNLGRRIAAKAREFAGRGGAQRVVAAVDVQNGPALAAYEKVGFRHWDRRTVYGRLAITRKRGNS
jgi:ribosomal protein S18 acetylase RimI-like enzyme